MRLASFAGPELLDLFYWANRVRRQFIGDQVSLCSIISAPIGFICGLPLSSHCLAYCNGSGGR